VNDDDDDIGLQVVHIYTVCISAVISISVSQRSSIITEGVVDDDDNDDDDDDDSNSSRVI